MFYTRATPWAVSYTHLDVYKRQEWDELSIYLYVKNWNLNDVCVIIGQGAKQNVNLFGVAPREIAQKAFAAREFSLKAMIIIYVSKKVIK